MEPITMVRGRVVPLDRADVDTDQIMPKQYLKWIGREGFGEVVFDDWRRDRDFVLNDPAYAGANILVAGPNLGSGSSREHAVWGLQQYGFDAVIASSFGDIFANNCAKTGLVAVQLDENIVRQIMRLATDDPACPARIDLQGQRLVMGAIDVAFEMDGHTRHALLSGLDGIDQTLTHEEAIAAFEQRRDPDLPSIT